MYSFANTPYSFYLSLPHHPGIYLVSDDGESMSLSDGQNVEEVLFGVAGAAGVRGVVDDDGRSLRVDLSLQVSKVSLPTSVCLQATGTAEGLMYYNYVAYQNVHHTSCEIINLQSCVIKKYL